MLTWEKLKQMNPALGVIEDDIKALAPAQDEDWAFCAIEQWYKPGGFRARLQRQVGHGLSESFLVSRAVLESSEAYDLAYDYLYGLLPDCGHAGRCC
jgi:hypothetical protein